MQGHFKDALGGYYQYNQADVEERNTQVRQMKDIFQRSQRTLIWLGREAHDSASAMEVVNILSKTSQTVAQGKTQRNVDKRPLGLKLAYLLLFYTFYNRLALDQMCGSRPPK